MIINYFNFLRPGGCPDKNESPLVIDPDAVLADTVTFQSLQPITGRHSQIVQLSCDL